MLVNMLICCLLTYGLARAQEIPARPSCFDTCAEFNAYAIRCGCGNACMFRRDAGIDDASVSGSSADVAVADAVSK